MPVTFRIDRFIESIEDARRSPAVDAAAGRA